MNLVAGSLAVFDRSAWTIRPLGALAAEAIEKGRPLLEQYRAFSETMCRLRGKEATGWWDECLEWFGEIRQDIEALGTSEDRYGSQNRGELLVACMGERPVGCVGVRRLGPECAELKRLFVVYEARGSRVGQALVREAHRTARDLGYSRIVGEMMRWAGHGEDGGIVRFYERLGWSTTKVHDWIGEKYHVMERELHDIA
ncbi:hypothetical protein BE17_37570 [Sorangium cellulosum]|uniref:N-acetyltransferase domain-containing protein n=1 Tax=Sorangium cellulosum TaxID=56 RepID=A0A150R4Q5_SORCE|nr:hypothetical protein BE17_37570 [Sorangium cellulosum]